jgi:hypothetical protein
MKYTFILPLLVLVCLNFNAAAQDFYGPGVQEIRIDLPFNNWDYKLDSLKQANREARLMGTANVNGTRFDSVGIRYKGNSSYFRSRHDTYRKLPLNVKVDYKIKSQKIKEGFSTIKLSNAFLDPSYIRDPLAYEVIRNYMPAPLCNFSKVYINGKFYGLYVNTEAIDPGFIRDNFGTNAGHLVKCDPDNWKRVRSQTGCPKGENASLIYLNDNTGCYDAFYEVDNPAAWKPMLNLIKTLNKTPEKIEKVLDVDQTLWMLALNNALVNLDSYNGSLSHNYYLWIDTSGVAHPIIWDLNMSFGGWRRNFSFEEMKDEALIQYHPLAEIDNLKRPLISRLLRNPFYRKLYLAHLKTIVTDYLQSGALLNRAESMMAEIDPYVKRDSMRLYNYDTFKTSLDETMHDGPDNIIGLRQLMSKRSDFLINHPLLNKAQPGLDNILYLAEGNKIKITAHMTDAKAGWLMYRKSKISAFSRTPMYDDGTNGDETAGDGIFTGLVDALLLKQYYLVAEGEEGATTMPERASHDFYEIQ